MDENEHLVGLGERLGDALMPVNRMDENEHLVGLGERLGDALMPVPVRIARLRVSQMICVYQEILGDRADHQVCRLMPRDDHRTLS